MNIEVCIVKVSCNAVTKLFCNFVDGLFAYAITVYINVMNRAV